MDVLTFCTIPSHFRFFFFEADFTAFLDFLTPLTEQTFYFARILFLTPQFLRFVQATFLPLLHSTILDRTTLDAGPFLAGLAINWNDCINLCPTFIWTFLSSGNAIDILTKCFWEPLVRDPSQYLAYRFDDQLPLNFFPSLLPVLAAGHCGAFVSLIGASTRSAFVKPPSAGLGSAFDVRVFDDFDLCVLQSIPRNSTPSFDAVGRQRPFTLYVACPAVKPGDRAATAFSPEWDYFLRQLLKAAPALPRGVSVSWPQAKGTLGDLCELVRSLFVDGAALEALPQQARLFTGFRVAATRTFPKTLLALTNACLRMRVAHTEEQGAQIAVHRLRGQLDRWMGRAEEPLRAIGDLLHSDVLARKNEPPRGDFVANPAAFHRALKARVNAFESFSVQTLRSRQRPDLHLRALAKGVNLRAYRRQCPQLRALDLRLRSSFPALLERSVGSPSPEAKREVALLVANEPHFRAVVERIRVWYAENGEPLAKATLERVVQPAKQFRETVSTVEGMQSAVGVIRRMGTPTF
jgi:hypothetical protein